MMVFSLAIIASCSQSQDRPAFGRDGGNFNPEDMAKQRAARVSEALELNEQQTTDLEKLYLKYMEKQRELREENSGDRDAMRESMQKIATQQEEEMKTLFTEEQWTKWLEVREQFRQRQPRRGGEGREQT